MERKIYSEIGGKIQEIHPMGETIEPSFTNERTLTLGNEFSCEIPFTKDVQTFIEQMKNEFSVVDITNWPALLIKRLLEISSPISKLVTRNAEHYQRLQTEDGFVCVAGDYDTLFGVPLILDTKGKIKAAQVEIKMEGGDTDD